MSELPKHLEKKGRDEEEVGAEKGEVTGAWRIVRNGMILAAVALGAIWLVYA